LPFETMLSCLSRSLGQCSISYSRRSYSMSRMIHPLFNKQTDQQPKENNNKKQETKKQRRWNPFKDEYVREFLKACNFCSTGLASLLGAAAARKAGMSTVGCLALSFVSGMGGGTIRDVLISQRVSWLQQQPRNDLLCTCTGLLGAYGWEELKKRTGISEDGLWAKIVSIASLGGCTCAGAEAAMSLTSNTAGQLAYGGGLAAITATGGGCLRDYMLHKRPAVLYDGFENAVPAMAGAFAYQTARRAHASLAVQTIMAFITSCGLRSCVRHYRTVHKKH